jgi:hypothetical protein
MLVGFQLLWVVYKSCKLLRLRNEIKQFGVLCHADVAHYVDALYHACIVYHTSVLYCVGVLYHAVILSISYCSTSWNDHGMQLLKHAWRLLFFEMILVQNLLHSSLFFCS